jgi:hypothetical protein
MIKKYPLAIASAILGLASFVHLFGLEKAVLAVVFGGLALQEVMPGFEKGKKYAYIGIILGSLYIVVLAVITVIKGPQILGLIRQMR